MNKYILSETSDFYFWDEFVSLSPQGNIYCKSSLILSIFSNSKFFFVKKSNEFVGAVSVLIDHDNNVCTNPPYFQYYNSILFRDNSKLLNQKIVEQFG